MKLIRGCSDQREVCQTENGLVENVTQGEAVTCQAEGT